MVTAVQDMLLRHDLSKFENRPGHPATLYAQLVGEDQQILVRYPHLAL